MKFLPFILLISLVTALYAVKLSPNTLDNSLIIYNSNIGLVHEKRQLSLMKNDTTIIYEDVASSINTDSINVSFPKAMTLYSQQYRFDKLTQNKLINAHIGKKIHVQVMKDSKNFTTIEAKLLSNDGRSCIVQSNKKIIIVESKNIIFKKIPSELITKPSLVWNVKAKRNISTNISIDYLINSITWKSNYILNLDEDEASLIGWVSIDNRSGKSFTNTSLHVLAGDINRAIQPRENYRAVKSMSRVQHDSPSVAHQAHEGYHFYTIPFKVNLSNNEKTQVKFISKSNIPVQRKYIATMNNPNYLNGEINHDVTQFVTLKGLEIPLPKGIVRTYSKLNETNILLGETNIKHTPKDTALSLKLGKNFDIKVKETILKQNKSSWNIDVDVQYNVKNTSDESKAITILVPFNKKNGSKVKSDKKYTFTKGNIVTFKLKVPANSAKSFNVYYRTKVTK